MSSLDYLDLCRLCLVKDGVSVPIFEGEGDVRQIFLKITACLPVKVAREDKLPKKICQDCVCKVELFYAFCNTTANSEKQLLQLLGDVQMEDDKQNYIGNVLNSNEMKSDDSKNNRLEDNVMHQVGEHQSGMNIMDNIMDMPMMISDTTQQITSVPMDTTGESVQNVSVAGPSTQMTHEQVHINQNQSDTPMQQEEEEESSEEDENFEEECDADEGLPVKEESEEDPNNRRAVEPTTFVNVSLACEEAGPSGLQQQKITELSDTMVMPQTEDVDPKTGIRGTDSRAYLKNTVERKIANPRFVLLRKINDQTILLQSVPSYSCDSCDENFNTEADLIVHKTEQSILRTRKALRQAEPKYKCDTCEKTFSTKFLLMRHCATPCKYPVPKNTVTKQERQDTIAQYVRTCAVNKKSKENKTTKGNKKSKEKNKSEEKKKSEENKSDENKESSTGSIECDKCDKCFKKRRYLKVHKTLHESPYICNICGSKLTSEYFLKIHIRRHNKEFTEFCEICNKGFYLRATLKNHMSVHTAEKPYVCEICNKAFGNRVYLRSHMQIHCKPEMRKTFKCEICNFQTFYSYCYRQHVWTHTGESQVACEVCGKLIRRQYMKIHMRIHTGEKPEICEFCGKAFSSRKYLIKHRRIHTGEKPYQCKICKKSFTQRGTLTLHLRRHEDRK